MMVTATTTTKPNDDTTPTTEAAARSAKRRPMPSDARSLALVRALVQAVTDAEAVKKDARNEAHDFKYAPAERKLRSAKAALTAHGLIVITRSSRILERGRQPILERIFEVTHVDGGRMEFGPMEWPIVVRPGHPLDKATATACTALFADFLRTELMIECEDEATMEARDDRDFTPDGTRRGKRGEAQAAPQGNATDARRGAADDAAPTDGARRMTDEDVARRYATHCDRVTNEGELYAAATLSGRLRDDVREMCAAYERFTRSRLAGEEWRASRNDVEAVKALCGWRDLDAPWVRAGAGVPAPTIIDDAAPLAPEAATAPAGDQPTLPGAEGEPPAADDHDPRLAARR